MKKPTTINLDSATRARLEQAQDRLTRGRIRPSMSEVANEAIDRGLPTLLGDTPSQPPPSGRAA